MGEKKLIDKFKTLEESPAKEPPELKVVPDIPGDKTKSSESTKKKNSKELQRLIDVLQGSESKTISLIKDVVQSKAEKDDLILRIILHSLDNFYLKKISQYLSQDEKSYLFNSNFKLPTSEELKEGTTFLEAKLNELNLINSKLANQHALNKLLSFSINEMREFIELNSKLGAKSLSLFPPEKVSQILEGYDKTLLEQILNQVDDFNSTEEIRELEEKILTFKSKRYNSNSFIKNFPFIIKELDVTKERYVLDQIKHTTLNEDQIKSIQSALPMTIISMMSEEFFSKVGEGLSLEDKVKIIISSSQPMISNIQNGFFPLGTQIYEMYKIEESNITGNETSLRAVKRNENNIWKEFAKSCREEIFTSQAYQDEFKNVLNEWVDDEDSDDDY
jgi:hypothetical protein